MQFLETASKWDLIHSQSINFVQPKRPLSAYSSKCNRSMQTDNEFKLSEYHNVILPKPHDQLYTT